MTASLQNRHPIGLHRKQWQVKNIIACWHYRRWRKLREPIDIFQPYQKYTITSICTKLKVRSATFAFRARTVKSSIKTEYDRIPANCRLKVSKFSRITRLSPGYRIIWAAERLSGEAERPASGHIYGCALTIFLIVIVSGTERRQV